MTVLIDTHIWIWLVNKPQRIGTRTRRLLADLRQVVLVSPVSIWEVILVARKGRLGRSTDPYRWLDKALSIPQLIEAPVTREIALEMGRFKLPHDDPADRWLAATARVLKCKLVTDDEKIIDSGVVETIPND